METVESSWGQPYSNGQIIDLEIAAIYRLFQSIFPAFFYPVHLFRSDTYRADIPWEQLVEDATMGHDLENVKQQLMEISKLVPENIVTAANLVRLHQNIDIQDMSLEELKAISSSMPIVGMLVGVRHLDPLMRTQKEYLNAFYGKDNLVTLVTDQGFINQFGFYRDRSSAYEVIKFHGNVLRGRLKLDSYKELYSEHLH